MCAKYYDAVFTQIGYFMYAGSAAFATMSTLSHVFFSALCQFLVRKKVSRCNLRFISPKKIYGLTTLIIKSSRIFPRNKDIFVSIGNCCSSPGSAHNRITLYVNTRLSVCSSIRVAHIFRYLSPKGFRIRENK